MLTTGNGDGSLAAALVLGTGPNYNTNSAENPADVIEVSPTLFLGDGNNAGDLFLRANDAAQVGQAFIELREPITELQSANGTEQLEANFIRRQ